MLELYQAEGYPYCERVREKLTDLGVSYVTHNPRTAAGDRRNEQTHAELLELGGEDQTSIVGRGGKYFLEAGLVLVLGEAARSLTEVQIYTVTGIVALVVVLAYATRGLWWPGLLSRAAE